MGKKKKKVVQTIEVEIEPKENNRLKSALTWLFYLLFSLCFTLVVINIIFHNTIYPYETAYVVPIICLVLGFLTAVYLFFSKYESFLKKHYRLILGLFLGIMAIVQLYYGKLLQFTPYADMDAIFNGAVQWVETGTFTDQYSYMYVYQNNLGPMAFLRVIFWISKYIFGSENYFIAAMVANCAMCITMMGVISVICKKIMGYKQAVFVLVIFAISRPFWYISAVIYTDAMAILFPALFYLLYLYSKEAKTVKKRILYYCLMGVVITIGMCVKFPVLIMAIAVLIDMLFNCDWKKTLSCFCIVTSIILIFNISFNMNIYTYHLDRETARQKNTPYLHWIMMGLNGKMGQYEQSEHNYTHSFPPEERNKALWDKTVSRIKEKGYRGLMEFYAAKSNRSLGDGTFAFSDFLDDGPVHQNSLQDTIFYDGENYPNYINYCSSVLFSIYIIMTAYAVSLLFCKKAKRWQYIAPQIAVLGMLFFLMIWEANGRFITCMISIFYLSAVMGIDWFAKSMVCMAKKAKESFLN